MTLTFATLAWVAVHGGVLSVAAPPDSITMVQDAGASALDLEEMVRRLTALEAELRAAPAAFDRRDALTGEMDRLRERLIERSSDDDRAPTWLVDRAAHALAQLARDDLDLVVLVGLPSERDRATVRVAAAKAIELLDQASRSATRAVAALESDTLTRPGLAGAADKELARLIDVEQAQRIPFFTGLARGLLAGAGATESERASAATAAVKALDAITVRSAPMEPARDAMVALAVLNASPTLSERAGVLVRERLQRAKEHPASEAATRRRAALGRLALGDPGDETVVSDPIAEEAIARGELLRAGRLGRLTQVSGAIARLIERDARGVGEDPNTIEARRARLYAKLAAQVDPRSSRDVVAPDLVFAKAVTLLRDRPTARRDATGLLDHLAGRADASIALRADALWELAASLREEQPDLAAKALGRLVREAGDSSRGLDAARLIGDNAHATASDRRAALELLIEKTIEPRWGRDAVALELEDSGGADAETRLRASIAVFERLDAARQRSAVEPLRQWAERLPGFWENLPRGVRSELADELFRPLARMAPEDAARAALAIGESELRSGDAQAAERRLSALVGSTIDRPGGPIAARLRLALADAQVSLSRTDDAFATLRALADQFEKPAGARGRDAPYWGAWARMLELFAADAGESVDGAALATHLSRLEIVDPALGGTEFAPRFAKLKALAERARARATAPPPAPPGASPGG